MNALQSLLAAEQASGGLGSFILLPLLGVLVYMMIVPQRKQKKKQAEMLAALRVGDDVVTTGGIHGSITYLEDSIAHVLVDTDVVIRVSKTAVNRVAGADPEPDGDDVDSSDDAIDVTESTDGDNASGAIVQSDTKKGKASKPATS